MDKEAKEAVGAAAAGIGALCLGCIGILAAAGLGLAIIIKLVLWAVKG